MKELYKIKVSGPCRIAAADRAWEIFEERAEAGLSTILVDEGRVKGIYEGLDHDYVTVETVEEGHELTVTEVQ